MPQPGEQHRLAPGGPLQANRYPQRIHFTYRDPGRSGQPGYWLAG
ncbi:hypothetical protein [Amycolatopsis sp. NPDC021455]